MGWRCPTRSDSRECLGQPRRIPDLLERQTLALPDLAKLLADRHLCPTIRLHWVNSTGQYRQPQERVKWQPSRR